MAKITMAQIYRQICDRRSGDLEDREHAGYEAMAYDFSSFEADVRAGDLITSTRTIREKWMNAVSDGVIQVPEGCKPYSKAILWIAVLRARAEGRTGGARVCVRVCDNVSHATLRRFGEGKA